MSLIEQTQKIISSAVLDLKNDRLIEGEFDEERFSVELPRDPMHGDISTNVAMVFAKDMKMRPRDLAQLIVDRIEVNSIIDSVEIAGPGFINLHFNIFVWHSQLVQVLRQGAKWGDSSYGQGKSINVEYVSANPTGPLHVGHVRGAVLGDVISNLLKKIGYAVTREYYINDAGAQIDTLARSLHIRYREACGEQTEAIPDGLYPGSYLETLGDTLARKDGRKWCDAPETVWLGSLKLFAVKEMLELIKKDLNLLGIEHDIFYSESELHRKGLIKEAIKELMDKELIYEGVLRPPKGKEPEDWEPRPQTLFKSSDFGDDTDRPLRKSDGSYTYFAADIAYHRDKYNRGYASLIDIWGADHGGYIKRVQAAVEALTDGRVDLDVKICNLVKLSRGGQPIKMSKRSGDFVTVRELVGEVGSDVVRFMMLIQKPESPLDFDFVKVAEKSSDNPVFYVQYAHARIRSLIRRSEEVLPEAMLHISPTKETDLGQLTDPGELNLIRQLSAWPRTVQHAALAHEPHRVAYFLYELANLFHSQWNQGIKKPHLRFLVEESAELSMARLSLCRGVAAVIASGLGVLGVEPVEEMR